MKETECLEEHESGIDIHKYLNYLFIYWQFFFASILICLIIGYVYITIKKPVYEVKASVFIKEDNSTNKNINNSLNAVLGESAIYQSFDNELEIFKSSSLIQDVIEDNQLNVCFFEKGISNNKEYFKEMPFQLILNSDFQNNITDKIDMDVHITSDSIIKMKYKSDGKEINKEIKILPSIIQTKYGKINIIKNSRTSFYNHDNDYNISIIPPSDMTDSYLSNLSVEPKSKTTTIAEITFKCSNVDKGKDFIQALIRKYNLITNNNKNEVASNTAEFINERINIINKELATTESNLESFKRKEGLTDIKNDARTALDQVTEYDKNRVSNATELRIIELIGSYIDNPSNKWDLLPINIGITDERLTAAINKYNDLILARNKLLQSSSDRNPSIITLNLTIESMRKNLLATIASVVEELKIKQNRLECESSRYKDQINKVPSNEREYLNISRQQGIEEGLYLMLLQKREENAIKLASIANNAKIIDRPRATKCPISPKREIIILISIIVGISIPIAFIYITELLKYKIESQDDIKEITDTSIIGEIPEINVDINSTSIIGSDDSKNYAAEMLKIVRTNILYMLDTNEKVIMVTSGNKGEGKSFVASNIAQSIALLDKKVLLVGLDLRRPGLNKILSIDKNNKGITNYLASPDKISLETLIVKSVINENLHILTSGDIPPNPTELLSRTALPLAIENFKTIYDYIIIDTPPLNHLTDTDIIGKMVDLTIYLCRANFTHKKEFEYIKTLYNTNKYKKVCTLLNGVDLNSRKYKYGYGYHRYSYEQ